MKNINFFKFYKVFYLISLLLIVAGIFLSLKNGLKLGTDFKGGLATEITLSQEKSISSIKKIFNENNINIELEKVISKKNTFNILLPLIEDNPIKTENLVKKVINNNFQNPEINQTQAIGGVISSQNRTNAIWVSLGVILLITAYLTFRFRFRYGVSAILAVIHDVLIVFLFIAILKLEINILVIMAMLTIFGYSVNDTIVLFDRVREITEINKNENIPYIDILNRSVKQTLSRTLITSLTTLLVVFSLYIATEGIYKEFSLLLMIGIVSGTYSTIYIASSTLIFWNRKNLYLKN